MPPPASTDELLDRIRRSGLVPVDDLDFFVADLSDAPVGGWTPPDLLDKLVALNYLTLFQADQIAGGKYKGFVLGSYVILDKIGVGAMGQVFLAEHAAMRRLVALKVLPGPVAEDTVSRERFFREARAAAALNHPHIMRVFDLNREGRLLYLVMEFIEGLNLTDLVSKGGPLPVAAAVDYMRQVALGLQAAHEKGLVHRDIKPSNILVDRDGAVKILDLGLVRSEADVDSRLTAQYGNTILGTADYLAPEQAVDSSNVDIRADIYGLAATLYYLLAGHPMFPTGRTAQKLMWQQWKDPERITSLRPDVPEALADLIHRCLAKKRDDRPETPQVVIDALAEWSQTTPLNAEYLSPVPHRRWMNRADSTAMSSGVQLDSNSMKSGRLKTETRTNLPLPSISPTPRPVSTVFADRMRPVAVLNPPPSAHIKREPRSERRPTLPTANQAVDQATTTTVVEETSALPITQLLAREVIFRAVQPVSEPEIVMAAARPMLSQSPARMLALSIGLGLLIGAAVVGAASLTLWMK